MIQQLFSQKLNREEVLENLGLECMCSKSVSKRYECMLDDRNTNL